MAHVARHVTPVLLQGASASSAVAAAGLGGDGSGSLSKASHNGPSVGMLTKMRTIMKRQQCIEQHEALFNCFNGSHDPSSRQSSQCSQYMEALTYCQLQTQQHNYPINTAYLF